MSTRLSTISSEHDFTLEYFEFPSFESQLKELSFPLPPSTTIPRKPKMYLSFLADIGLPAQLCEEPEEMDSFIVSRNLKPRSAEISRFSMDSFLDQEEEEDDDDESDFTTDNEWGLSEKEDIDDALYYAEHFMSHCNGEEKMTAEQRYRINMTKEYEQRLKDIQYKLEMMKDGEHEQQGSEFEFARHRNWI